MNRCRSPLVAGCALLAVSCCSAAFAGSLYSGLAPRPGPDILYADLVDAPQFQNTGSWRARPILVSGASAYRKGEFLYQDYLYDDHGARQLPDPTDPMINTLNQIAAGNPGGATAASLFALANGTYTYPTDAAYAGNAADLVELRVGTTVHATTFRVTLNTLLDPSKVAFTIAIGGDAAHDVAWPYGANVRAPAELFLSVVGGRAELLHGDGTPFAKAPSLTIDKVRRQFRLQVPKSLWNPAQRTVRLAAGVGLWDAPARHYLLPQAIASAAKPGGAGLAANPAAFFNVAFRYHAQEPMPSIAGLDAATIIANPSWWRDAAQGAALASGDIGAFFADVDFARLAAGDSDDLPNQPKGTPKTGPMNRIYASHFEPRQGVDYTSLCSNSISCQGALLGRLQPYAIYVPEGPAPAGGWGLTLLLHSLAANYNQFLGSRNQSQFAARGKGSIVITATGRGPDGWYYDLAGADTFEMWADVAARFRLDPRDTVIAGYSMGGYATFKFATQYPDLFARAQPTVGPAGQGVWVPPLPVVPGGEGSNTVRMLPSLRHIPVLGWYGAIDELVPVAGVVVHFKALADLGYAYELDVFPYSDHLALAANDQYQPAADFLGEVRVNANPAHVTYVYNPTMEFPAVGMRNDHAYWISEIRLRDASGPAPIGQVDAVSEARGVVDGVPSGVAPGAGVLQGGAFGPFAYVSAKQTVGPSSVGAKADRVRIRCVNVAALTIQPKRAGLTCAAEVVVESADGPVEVRLQGCPSSAP